MPVPSSTYRLQITSEFTLFDAADLTGYLAELGAGAVYVSPLLQATAGSMHGYDVVDHRWVDRSRGGVDGLEALAAACARHGLGLVVDIVPNHMGVAVPSENAAWWDVLRDGQASPYAAWFDIEWSYGGKVLIPVLGDGADPERELTVDGDELRYYEHRYPIAAGTGHGTPAEVHARQHYELVNFRRADTEQNYRRFFAVTDLAGLRVEDEAVFEATHREILRWVSDYGVTGIRIDHPDGLVAPGAYLERLAARAPDSWITVEKITEPGEELPAGWPVAGMTGYDALAEVNALLVDPAVESELTRLYRDLTGDNRSFAEHIADGKRLVATSILHAEIRRLARLAPEVVDAVAALTELVVAFPVYRSYLPLGREYLDEAVRTASTRRPELVPAIDQLLPRLSDPADELASRFQQVTGAVMAKGVEDTAYYRYNRFIALNEVGGDPATFGSGVAEFHAAQLRRAARFPDAMTTLSTHDTKRGEDIRARLAAIAELREEWAELVTYLLDAAPVPNRAFGYLLWQTVVATGLTDRSRLHAYLEKAMREAADGTGWIDPEEGFEAAVHAALDSAFTDPTIRARLADFSVRLDGPGWVNSLSQKLIQLTMAGCPDVYQGTEVWEDSLVDPDNRRPVPFARLAERLRALKHPPEVDDTGAAKQWLVSRVLRARRDRAELFTGYTPLLVEGAAQDHLVAFDRGGAITLATRLPVGVAAAGGWVDTVLELPVGDYVDALTGRRATGSMAVSELFHDYPVALLLKANPDV